VTWSDDTQTLYYPTDRAMFAAWSDLAADELAVDVELLPACRCYRCGLLMHEGTLTVDRIIPGCQGGTYRRNNIRPACGDCNSETGATTRRKARR
jgi:hypothetical protein